MSRRRKPPRLYLRPARPSKGERERYVVLDGEKEIGTGCGPDDLDGAKEFLGRYLAQTYQPPAGATSPE
jgi:hypothetical protein